MIALVGTADPGLFVLKSAVRAAIVVPLAFAIPMLAIADKQAALFAAFGSMALLVFVDFGGSRRSRLHAYLGLLAGGAVLIAVGTLCSQSTLLATVAMALVAFAILFAGVLDDYVAAARTAALLTFVLPVMLPAGAAAILPRLAGWGIAAALSIAAALLLWPARPRGALLVRAAALARLLARLVEARSAGRARGCRGGGAGGSGGDARAARPLRRDGAAPERDGWPDGGARAADRGPRSAFAHRRLHSAAHGGGRSLPRRARRARAHGAARAARARRAVRRRRIGAGRGARAHAQGA